MLNKRIFIYALSLFLTPASVLFASDNRVYEGCYVPTRGYVETQSYSPLEQLGELKIVLRHENWKSLEPADQKRIARRLVIKGVLAGKVDPMTNLASHVITDKSRNGILFTSGDLFIPSTFDCFVNGVPKLMTGREIINIVSGTGKFNAVQPSTVYVDGSINSCPTDPDFGKNDFQAVPNMGAVCFTAQ